MTAAPNNRYIGLVFQRQLTNKAATKMITEKKSGKEFFPISIIAAAIKPSVTKRNF